MELHLELQKKKTKLFDLEPPVTMDLPRKGDTTSLNYNTHESMRRAGKGHKVKQLGSFALDPSQSPLHTFEFTGNEELAPCSAWIEDSPEVLTVASVMVLVDPRTNE